jgi:HEAT repeat protein
MKNRSHRLHLTIWLLSFARLAGTAEVVRSNPKETLQETLVPESCVTIISLDGPMAPTLTPAAKLPQAIPADQLPQIIQALRDPQENICDRASQLKKIGQPAVLAVIPLLQDQAPVVRLRAAIALGTMGKLAEPATSSLIALLKDPEPVIRLSTITALNSIGPSPAPLIPLLNDANVEVQSQAAQTLFSMGGESARLAVPKIISLIKNPKFQKTAVTTLLLMPEQSKLAIPFLIPLLKDPDTEVRSIASNLISQINSPLCQVVRTTEVVHFDTAPTTILGAIDEPAKLTVPQLILLIQTSNNATTCNAAMAALREMGPIAKPAIPALVPLLKDIRINKVAESAERTIVAIGPSAIPELLLLLNDTDPLMRREIAYILGYMRESAKTITPELTKRLKDISPQVRSAAVSSLANIEGPIAVMPLLIPLLKDPDGGVRQSTAWSLTIIRDVETNYKMYESLIPHLIPLLKDESVVTRIRVLALLEWTAWTSTELAKPAIPELISLLQDSNSSIRKSAATTLRNLRKAPVVTTGASGKIGKPIAVNQSSQASEVQQFLSRNWKSPKKLKRGLEYRVEIAPDGTRQALTPLTKESIVFIDHVPFPLEGEPFVSPNLKGSPTVVRIIIERDHAIRVFLEE